MPDTSYHNWTMPTVDGSTDVWGQELNDMFDNEIDAVVERRGTLANRPSAANVPNGAKYLVTSGDEAGSVFIESGDSWTTPGRLRTKDYPVVDVTHPDFGAEGDGTTDDQAAIQAAVDHAETLAPGVQVYLPPGRYLVGDTGGSSSAIRARYSGVEIVGAGPSATVLESQFSSGGSSTDDGDARFMRLGGTRSDESATSAGDSYEYAAVRDLRIENPAGFDGNTVSIEQVDKMAVENVAIDNTATSDSPGLPIALGFDEDDGGTNQYALARGCIILNESPNNKCIEFAGVDRAVATGNVIQGFDSTNIPGSSPSGISAVACERVAFTGNTIDLPQQDAPCIQILGTRRASVAGNQLYGGNHSITVGGASTSFGFDAEKVVLSGNYCETPATDGLRIDSPTSWVVATGNMVHSPGQDGASWATVGGLQFVGNQIVDAGRNGITNARATEFRQAMVVGNMVRAPASTGIVIETPGTGGGVIALNHVSNIGDGGAHILIDNTNGDPSDYVLLGNNCTRSGTGITENGTPTNNVTTDNNT